LQPCGQCRLVGRRLVAIIVSARLGHQTFGPQTSAVDAPDLKNCAFAMHPTRSNASSKIAADPPPPKPRGPY
jgi:hypothetical protein